MGSGENIWFNILIQSTFSGISHVKIVSSSMTRCVTHPLHIHHVAAHTFSLSLLHSVNGQAKSDTGMWPSWPSGRGRALPSLHRALPGLPASWGCEMPVCLSAATCPAASNVTGRPGQEGCLGSMLSRWHGCIVGHPMLLINGMRCCTQIQKDKIKGENKRK